MRVKALHYFGKYNMESIPKQNIDRLWKIAATAATGLGLGILRFTARGTPSRPILEVILDGSKYVSIDYCQVVNRVLNDAIEADESLLKGNFRLDVLSPGLDEPLVYDYQFKRTIGHLVEITLGDGEKISSLIGTLNSVSPTEIMVTKRLTKRGGKKENAEEVHIPRKSITKAFARPDFGKI
jgi:ribosome maturation factor RimP